MLETMYKIACGGVESKGWFTAADDRPRNAAAILWAILYEGLKSFPAQRAYFANKYW